MKCTFCLIVLAVASICSSQTQKRPNLSKFSSDQLKSCYSDKTVCGTDDVYAISDELARRLPALTTEQLVACFADWKICGVENDLGTGFAVSAEIARRGNPHELLVRYWSESDGNIRYGIVQVAYHSKTSETADFMQKVLAAGRGDEDALYWSADYLAKRCDLAGLKWLSERQGRPEGCLVWTHSVALFGKCHFRPAIPYIIDNSIHDACLNIDDEGFKDLRQFFPDSPRQFKSVEEMQNYYCARARKEGFRVQCPAD